MEQGQEEWYGKTMELTAEAAVRRLEAAISDGYSAPAAHPLPGGANLFGRQAVFAATPELDFAAGLAATGLRAAAFLSGEKPAGQLSKWARLHLGLVVHATAQPPEAFSRGAFQFRAANAQEALDFAAIAHRVAELALIPGLNVLELSELQSVQIPSRAQLLQFLGGPDDYISCPTPAQEMIFGKKRRRLPNWASPDFPALAGISKDEPAVSLEAAARSRYFYHHLPAIIRQVMEEFGSLTGRHYAPLTAYQAEGADFLIISQGGAAAQAMAAAALLREKERARVGCVNLSLISPFPAAELAALMAGRRAVAVLEPVTAAADTAGGALLQELKAAISGLGRQQPECYSGYYAAPLRLEDAVAAFRNMMKGGQGKKQFLLGMDYTRTAAVSPQHQLLLQAIGRNYPGIEAESLHSSPAPQRKNPQGAALGMPRSVQRYRDHGAPYTRLSRFYHDTAAFYQNGEEEELVASPFEALPQSPAASALFANQAARRTELPVFLPENCTGCGQCAVLCPHAAIPPLAIGVEALIKGAMAISASRGTPLAQFTPLAKNLARLAGAAVKAAGTGAAKVSDFLPAAFERLLEQMKISGDKEGAVRREWGIILDIIGGFPVAITETFFHGPEAQERGAGAFFSLAVNPHACTGCGLCVQACPEGALEMAPQAPALLESLQASFDLWEQLPDSPPETVARLVQEPAYDSLAAILLSRNYYQSMAGGSLSESGAPAKAMLHLATAVTESVVQPRLVRLAREAGELMEALLENVHKKLSEALPRESLLTLENAVGEAGGANLPLDELVGKLAAHEHFRLVDTAELQRKLGLANGLKALRWAILEGPTGAGRARYALAVQAGLWPWAEQYPYNAFIAPALLDADGAAGLASGLFQGYLRHALDNIRLLRRARLEVQGKYRPEAHDLEIASLSWESLDETERGLAPPLLLVGNQNLLEGPQREALDALLASPWPVKVICLDDAAADVQATQRQLARGNAALFAAAALRNAFVWQGSLGAAPELYEGLRQGISRPRPAFFHLLAVGPEQLDAPGGQWPQMAGLALKTRAFPVLRFDPETEGGFLSQATVLDGNPAPDEDWWAEDLPGRESKGQPYVFTYADWLYAQRAWREHFFHLPAEGLAPLPMAEYLRLPPEARKGKAPTILVSGEEGRLEQLMASEQVVAATEGALHQWRMLREMAGALSPFPEKLRNKVEQELAEKYERELEKARAEFEAKLRNKEEELMQEVRAKLRDKLLALSRTPITPRL